MQSQNKVFDALRSLGVEVSFSAANNWIKKKYGSGVSDHSFYTSRRVFRQKQQPNKVQVAEMTPVAAPEVSEAAAASIVKEALEKSHKFRQNQALEAVEEAPSIKEATIKESATEVNGAPGGIISLNDLLKVQKFAVEMGGRERVAKILTALDYFATVI